MDALKGWMEIWHSLKESHNAEIRYKCTWVGLIFAWIAQLLRQQLPAAFTYPTNLDVEVQIYNPPKKCSQAAAAHRDTLTRSQKADAQTLKICAFFFCVIKFFPEQLSYCRFHKCISTGPHNHNLIMITGFSKPSFISQPAASCQDSFPI